MFKYLFISLFLHLILIMVMYGSVNLIPFLEEEKDDYHMEVNIKGIGFYSTNRKEESNKRINKELKNFIKKGNGGTSHENKLISKAIEKEVVAKSEPSENKSGEDAEKGEIEENKQEYKEMFKETPKDVVPGADVNKGDIIETEDYTLIYTRQNLEVIRKIIADNIEYPIVARRMGWEGTVVIAFTLSKRGDLLGVEIIKSSGYSLLDEYTVSVIKEVYKRFPLPERDVRIKIPVSYHLE